MHLSLIEFLQVEICVGTVLDTVAFWSSHTQDFTTGQIKKEANDRLYEYYLYLQKRQAEINRNVE